MKADRIEIVATAPSRILALEESSKNAYRIGVGSVINYPDLNELPFNEIIEIHLPKIVAHAHDHKLKEYHGLPGHGDTKIYMQEVRADVPGSAKFPMEELQEWANTFPQHYWSSTIPHITARAIFLAEKWGIKEIHMFGVTVSAHEEYAYERPCIEFWGGVANAKGIEIVTHGPTSLFNYTHHYGYDDIPDFVTQAINHYDNITAGRIEIDSQIEQFMIKAARELEAEHPQQTLGAVDAVVALLQTRAQQIGSLKSHEVFMKRIGAWQDHKLAAANVDI